EDDPAAALDPRCDDLLRREGPPWQLLEFASKRWQAAASIGHPEVVAADLAVLRARLAEEASPEWWARALLAGVTALAWDSSPTGAAMRDDLESGLGGMGELQLSLSHELDQVEFLAELGRQFHSLEDLRANRKLLAEWEELQELESLLSRWSVLS